MSTLRAGATPPDTGADGGEADSGEADSEAVEAENKAIQEGAAAAKAMMDATDEFRAKQVRIRYALGPWRRNGMEVGLIFMLWLVRASCVFVCVGVVCLLTFTFLKQGFIYLH